MFKKYFLTGLLIWLPILATVFVIHLIVNVLDNVINFLPQQYQPSDWFGVHIPGLGVIVSLLVIFFTGLVMRNFFGNKIMSWTDLLISKIPLVRTIYSGTKQILETVMSSDGHSFRTVLLVEYPRKGMWSIAFQTGSGQSQINAQLGQPMLSVFIPTTPNPTSGFLLLVPQNEAIELKMPVEEALKFVVSLGTLSAADKNKLINETAVEAKNI